MKTRIAFLCSQNLILFLATHTNRPHHNRLAVPYAISSCTQHTAPDVTVYRGIGSPERWKNGNEGTRLRKLTCIITYYPDSAEQYTLFRRSPLFWRKTLFFLLPLLLAIIHYFLIPVRMRGYRFSRTNVTSSGYKQVLKLICFISGINTLTYKE